MLAYHSLEDRIVKQTFAALAKGCVCPPGFPSAPAAAARPGPGHDGRPGGPRPRRRPATTRPGAPGSAWGKGCERPDAIGANPIRQPDERSLAEAVRITLAIFALATPFFLYMGLSAAHVQEEYRLSRLVERRRQLVKEHERLLLTATPCSAPEP